MAGLIFHNKSFSSDVLHKGKVKNFTNMFMPLSFILSIPVLGLFYSLFNNPNRGVHSLVTDIDQGIPLVKIFIVPYISWYIFIFLTLSYLCFKDKDTYYKTLLAYNLSLIICYLVYFTYQTTVPRPVLVGDDIFTKFLSYIYSADQPYNCFPSIHALTSYLMIKAISTSSIKNKLNFIIISGTAGLIIISTLLVKQHVVLDALSAILLGDMVFKLVNGYWEGDLFRLRKSYFVLTMKKKLGI